MKVIQKVKGFVSTKAGKVSTVVGGAVMSMNVMAVSAFAATGDPVVDASITSAVSDGMSGIKTAAIATVGGMVAIAIGVFAGPFIIRYGKKIFKVASA
ncbi:hypothetical protein [Paenibacillus odorifer]|uniref:hypothetical protein n=1 Tax=Paenibacillus odorifer TaxID=189426 RepID=UPI0020BFE4FE|nr:hypothetical protein [Paenibacillus odorifer]